jgi:hypothetical protein
MKYARNTLIFYQAINSTHISFKTLQLPCSKKVKEHLNPEERRTMHRYELFEIHDHPWCPTFLRDLFTDALQAIWNRTNFYNPIAPLLSDALTQTHSTEILDLCSGAGGPWFRLSHDLSQLQDLPITIRLTDKYPNHEAFSEAHAKSAGRITFDPRSISATEVPPDLGGFRTMFSTFHHFRPSQARSILADAVEQNRGIAIFETAGRDPRTFLGVFIIPLLTLLLTPKIRPFHWSRILWTYLIPAVPFALWFDGLMSSLRAYSHQQLQELVQSLPANNYQWQIGDRREGFSPVTYLIGYPKP